MLTSSIQLTRGLGCTACWPSPPPLIIQIALDIKGRALGQGARQIRFYCMDQKRLDSISYADKTSLSEKATYLTVEQLLGDLLLGLLESLRQGLQETEFSASREAQCRATQKLEPWLSDSFTWQIRSKQSEVSRSELQLPVLSWFIPPGSLWQWPGTHPGNSTCTVR